MCWCEDGGRTWFQITGEEDTPFSNSLASFGAGLKDWVTEQEEVWKSLLSAVIKDSKCPRAGNQGNCCLVEFQKDLVNLILCFTSSNGRHSKPTAFNGSNVVFWPPSWGPGTWQEGEIVSWGVVSAWRRAVCSHWSLSYKGITENCYRRVKTPALLFSAKTACSQ